MAINGALAQACIRAVTGENHVAINAARGEAGSVNGSRARSINVGARVKHCGVIVILNRGGVMHIHALLFLC